MFTRPHWKLAVVLILLAPTAQAHGIRPIWVVGALSPIAVLLLTVVLGWLTRSVRLGAIHAALVIVWVVLFWLASSFVTSDYLIWTPLALFVLHTVVIVVLILRHALARNRSNGRAA
jgi:hypothetical protein